MFSISKSEKSRVIYFYVIIHHKVILHFLFCPTIHITAAQLLFFSLINVIYFTVYLLT